MADTLQVAQWRTHSIVMPKQDPTWRFALGANPESLGVVAELVTADGLVGYGYATELAHLGYELEDVERDIATLTSEVAEVPLWDLAPFLSRLTRQGKCRPAYAAVEMAVLDVRSKALGRPLADTLGGRFRDGVDVLRILSIKSPDKMASNAQAHVLEGYRYLKIKIDNDPMDLDAARIIAIREAVGPDVHLTLDANQSYDAEGAISLYGRVQDQGIDIFEQPVPEDDLDGLRRVTEALDCIVEADESASSVERAYRLLQSSSCSGISLKLLKLGGISATMQVARLCAAAGIPCRLGAHVGSRLLAAAALHVAVALENVDYACELGEFVRLNNDPFTGLEVTDGRVSLQEAVGVGVVPVGEGSNRPLEAAGMKETD